MKPPRPSILIIDDNDLIYTAACTYTYQDQLFSGIARAYSRAGKIIGEANYKDGMLDGRSRSWYPSGQLAEEAHFVRNGHSGSSREWHPNGRLKRETEFEFSIRLRERIWDPSGKLLKDYVLTEDNPQYQILENARKLNAKREY